MGGAGVIPDGQRTVSSRCVQEDASFRCQGIRGELSFPGNLLVPLPVWLPPDLSLVAVAAGGQHSVFLTDEGE